MQCFLPKTMSMPHYRYSLVLMNSCERYLHVQRLVVLLYLNFLLSMHLESLLMIALFLTSP